MPKTPPKPVTRTCPNRHEALARTCSLVSAHYEALTRTCTVEAVRCPPARSHCSRGIAVSRCPGQVGRRAYKTLWACITFTRFHASNIG